MHTTPEPSTVNQTSGLEQLFVLFTGIFPGQRRWIDESIVFVYLKQFLGDIL